MAARPSWTHYRALLQVNDPKARNWYLHEAAAQTWSTRTRQQHISTEEELRAEIEAQKAIFFLQRTEKRFSLTKSHFVSLINGLHPRRRDAARKVKHFV